jgi:uncharacterized membrane protein (UPF0127 family)
MLLIAAALFILGNQPVTLEEVKTPEQKSWGLMGRTQLGENEGMLFPFDPPQYLNVWMFNCWIDLDVAYLDANRVIREIHEMRAYPEKMDPRRPVLGPRDFSLYANNDPIVLFFQSKSVKSSFEASYIVEMPKGWFKRHEVGVGDTLEYKY